jgi:NADP-dependent 3-hydroxy acid dehydrogenase YdfG
MHLLVRTRKGEGCGSPYKVALITAFANGIGRATAEIIAREAWKARG